MAHNFGDCKGLAFRNQFTCLGEKLIEHRILSVPTISSREQAGSQGYGPVQTRRYREGQRPCLALTAGSPSARAGDSTKESCARVDWRLASGRQAIADPLFPTRR